MPESKKSEKRTSTARQTSRKTAASAAKSTTSRKRSLKVVDREEAGKYLSRVPAEQVFWCHDGAVLNDVSELRDSLRMMSDETFNYHNNEIKKDFSVWIRDVIGDEELADSLEKADGREEAARIVEQRCTLLRG